MSGLMAKRKLGFSNSTKIIPSQGHSSIVSETEFWEPVTSGSVGRLAPSYFGLIRNEKLRSEKP